MGFKKKNKVVSFKLFFLIFLIVGITYLFIASITVKRRIDENIEYLEKESIHIASSYSHSITNSTKAESIITKLLVDKLTVAGKAVKLYNGTLSNESLNDIATLLEVDVIYYYNDSGEILFSSKNEYVGWQAYSSHPAYEFMLSDQEIYIEEIRKDSESDIFYKYGFFRLQNDDFIQIGILADKVYDLINRFQIGEILKDLEEDVYVENICFMDNHYVITDSTSPKRVGNVITDQSVRTAVSKDENYSVFNEKSNMGYYLAYVPVFVDQHKIGTLVIEQSTDKANEVITDIIWDGVWVFLSALLIFGVTILLNYRKSKKHFQLAYFDPITDLPNRVSMEDFLDEKIKDSKKMKKAIMLFHYNNFKSINLTYGYEYGDLILKTVADKVNTLIGENANLFRFTADRFVLYIEDYKTQEVLIELTSKINQVLRLPFSKSNQGTYMEAEIGIVEFENQYQTVDQLMKDVSIALSYIEENVGSNYMFFNEEMEMMLKRERQIVQELQEALSSKTFIIYLEYQPQISMETNRIVAFEALARMKSDKLGFVSPLEFINVAEKNQLIIPLGRLILQKACEFIKVINENTKQQVKIAVNISGFQLLQVDFIDNITKVIKTSGIDSKLLELEITESILLDNYELINKKLKTLQEMGISIALDDFGTGYSSFARLGELHTNIIKIDRYFTNRITVKENNELISSDIISMAHKLGLKVVAEGVEEDEQKEYLMKHHCDMMQGYLFSKPLREEEAYDLLRKEESN